MIMRYHVLVVLKALIAKKSGKSKLGAGKVENVVIASIRVLLGKHGTSKTFNHSTPQQHSFVTRSHYYML